MMMLTSICDKIKMTQENLFQNIGHNQQNNSADSGNSEDHHEKTESPKTSSPHHQEDSNSNFQNKQLWNEFAN